MTETSYELPSHKVSVGLIMDVITRCSHGETALNALVTYTGKTESYVKSAICVGRLLEMIDVIDTDIYKVREDCMISITPSIELKISIFRSKLEKWYPFILYLRYLSNGDTSEVASRKLNSIFSFNKSHGHLGDLLKAWAKGAGFLDSKGEIINIKPNFDDRDVITKLSEKAFEETNLSLYLIEVIGEDVFKWLQHDEIEELKQSLFSFKENPRNAIQSAGRAFEDVIRRISAEVQLDTRKLNGITQLANNLYSNTNEGNSPFIHPKLKNISLAIGDIRNMAGHSKEAKTMERWELSSTAAIGSILTTISTIKGIYYYVNDNKFFY